MGSRDFAWLAIGVAVCALFAFGAKAQPDSFCLPSLSDAEEHLARYREVPLFAYTQESKASDGSVTRIGKMMFGNVQTEEWTLVIIDITGGVCTAVHGTGISVSQDALPLVFYPEKES